MGFTTFSYCLSCTINADSVLILVLLIDRPNWPLAFYGQPNLFYNCQQNLFLAYVLFLTTMLGH